MSSFQFSDRFRTAPLFLGERTVPGGSLLDAELLFTVGFLDPKAENEEPIQLADAWASKSGRICLFGEAPKNVGAVIDGINALSPDPGESLLWLLNPNQPATDWVWAALRVARDGPSRIVQEDVRLPLSLPVRESEGYFVLLPTGTKIDLNTEAEALGIVQGTVPLGFGRDDETLAIAETGIELALTPSLGFALRFRAQIPAGERVGQQLGALGLGIWIGHDDDQGRATALRFPLFADSERHVELTLDAQITPADLLDAGASRLTAISVEPATARYVSWYRSVLGRTVTLQPRDGRFDMHFTDVGRHGMALIPAGTFHLAISDQALTLADAGTETTDIALLDGRRLACGGSGTEAVVIPATAKASLRAEFVPGQPGYATGGTPAFSDRSRTSWMSLFADEPLVYQAQPPGAATFYDASNPQGTPEVPLLDYLPMSPAVLPAIDGGPVLPWVPLAGVPLSDRDRAISLEAGAVAPKRKELLSIDTCARLATGAKPAASLPEGRLEEPGDSLFAVTPNGLELKVSQTEAGERWDHVQIARLKDHIPGNAGQLRFARAEGVVDPLKTALLTNKQFIVISAPETIAPFFSGADATIKLRDWEFDLDPAAWRAHGTILIVKNSDLSVGDLIGDTGSWTEAEAFNRSAAVTSQTLKAIAKDARAALDSGEERLRLMRGEDGDSPGADLEFFVREVLDSPEWNGFLFLNALIKTYPQDLAGMRAGVRGDGLVAHHLGVSQTPFTTLADLQENSSSMFGLIRYADTSPAFGNGGFYDFRVRDLGVLFRNSNIRNFRTLVDLSMGPLFRQRARLDGTAPPICTLEGVRHLRENTDSYTFEAVEQLDLTFGSGPLQKMRIEQAEFLTVSVDPDPGGKTHTLFNFAGFLSFDTVLSNETSFDLFSFDQLGFGLLQVAMEFDNTEPLKPTYSFSTDAMELSEPHSVARPGSLFNGFPIKLDRIVAAKNQGVTGAGAMTVMLPHVPKKLPKSWYGLSLLLDMGTLSDVAGAAGMQAGLLLAWGPDAGQFFVGLDMSAPGLSGSGTELSLLGVLKLKLYALSLRQQDGNWLLMMHGMTLGVFSKTLPPGGNFDFYLFGNPDPSGSSHSLGWYGAWVKDKKDEQGEDNSRHARGTSIAGDTLLREAFSTQDLPHLIRSARLGNRDARLLQGDD